MDGGLYLGVRLPPIDTNLSVVKNKSPYKEFNSKDNVYFTQAKNINCCKMKFLPG